LLTVYFSYKGLASAGDSHLRGLAPFIVFSNKYFCIFEQYINSKTQNHKLMNVSSWQVVPCLVLRTAKESYTEINPQRVVCVRCWVECIRSYYGK